MNIIKKYWESVYIYILLLIPCLCGCAGIYWSICKMFGLYTELSWNVIGVFDLSQVIYLAIALYYICKNRKDADYILNHLSHVKCFILVSLFIQYNFIMLLFPSEHVWGCTFLFWVVIIFFFDVKMMIIHILLCLVSLLIHHMLRPEEFLPVNSADIGESISFRVLILCLVTLSVLLIVYFVERFLIQAQEDSDENVRLLEKQLEYYENMELLDTEIRKFRHDIQNHFVCMEHLLHSGKNEELQVYFNGLQQIFSFQEKIYYSGNDIMDAIMNYDIPHHCLGEVKVTVKGLMPELKTPSSVDVCIVFSNMLSNAISAVNRCVGLLDARLVIEFQAGKRFVCIAVSNTVCEKETLTFRRAHKDRNHGYGLSKIKEVLEKYDGKYEQYMEEDMIVIKVYLPI